EGAPAGTERKQFEPLAEAEPFGPLAVARGEFADETRGHGLEAGLRERGQKRAWVALAKEAARVRDPESLGGLVREALEVVVVRAVRDHGDGGLRLVRLDLVGDARPGGDDRVRLRGDEPGN